MHMYRPGTDFPETRTIQRPTSDKRSASLRASLSYFYPVLQKMQGRRPVDTNTPFGENRAVLDGANGLFPGRERQQNQASFESRSVAHGDEAPLPGRDGFQATICPVRS